MAYCENTIADTPHPLHIIHCGKHWLFLYTLGKIKKLEDEVLVIKTALNL